MMANWDILNEEFDAILNNITNEDWKDWYNNINSQKDLHQLEMILEARLHSEKIKFNKTRGKLILKEILKSDPMIDLSNIEYTDNDSKKNCNACGENNYALAA